MSDFAQELLGELGFDHADPAVIAAGEDARAHGRLIETLTQIRVGRELTQKDVAARMGTTQSRVSNFERIGGDPRLSTIMRYARAVDAKLHLGVTATPRGWEPVTVTSLPPSAVGPAPSAAPSLCWTRRSEHEGSCASA